MTIPANKKRLPIVLIVGLIVLSLLILLILYTVRHLNDEGQNKVAYLVAYIGISVWVLILTVFALLNYIKTRFDKHAALTITDKGINDNLNIFSVGDISWTDITEIKITTVFKTAILIIGVTNPQSFIERKSKPKQRTLRSLLNKFGSPVVISQKSIDYDLNDLKDILIKSKAQ